MAHIAKYKATSVGHMLAHYRRDASSLERDNIDPSRVKNDLVVGHYTNKDGKLVVGRVRAREGEPNWGTVERRIERVNEAQKTAGKRATRKDAVVMADVVVTLPDNVRNGRFNYKKMCPRSFYQSMHKELGDYLERRMGYRPAIELDEETRAQRVYTDKAVDIDKVRGAVDRAVVQPAEDEAARIVAAAKEEAAALLNEAEARKAELVAQIADKEGDLAELDSQLEDVKLDIEDEQDRLECLRQRADGVARDVAELRPIAADVRGWEAAGKAERGAILDRICAKCDGLASRIRADVAGIRLKVEELRSRISRPLEYLMPKPKTERLGLDDVMREATRAAEAWNRNHVAPTNGRPRGQSR